jgi:hypothetical protein
LSDGTEGLPHVGETCDMTLPASGSLRLLRLT